MYIVNKEAYNLIALLCLTFNLKVNFFGGVLNENNQTIFYTFNFIPSHTLSNAQ